MITITNYSPQANAYRFFNRNLAERHFKVRDELLKEAAETTNNKSKVYLSGQAALRDTKAREAWERVCAHAETLGTLVSEETVIAYKKENYPQLGITPKMSWWKTWLTNFNN